MADGVVADRTHASAATETPQETSRTRTIDELVEDAGHLRNYTRILGADVAETGRQVSEIHHQAFDALLNERARDVAKQDPTVTLNELATAGFSWRDIARLIGVSVPAVRRWRQGESPTGDHRLAIARLMALVTTLGADHLIGNVASWLEMPLHPDTLFTGIDLAAEGRYLDLLDIAADHVPPEDVLDRWRPGWRDEHHSGFEVFEADDGELGLRPISAENG